jgi:hypothetical protein
MPRTGHQAGGKCPRFYWVSSLPIWAVAVIAAGSPVLTAVLTVRGQALSRYATRGQENDSRRGEVLKTLRDSAMLGAAEVEFIIAALDAALEVPVLAIEQAGEDVEVVATTDVSADEEDFVPSEEDWEEADG